MATTEDIVIRCVDCGEDFLFTVGEQEFYKQHGLTNTPTRCKRCREARKSRPSSDRRAATPSSSPRETFTAQCSDCGAETRVPFQPTAGRPIYCRDCFQRHRSSGSSRGAGERTRGAERGQDRNAANGEDRSAADGETRGGTAVGTTGKMMGQVKWFDESRGYGFIHEDGGGDLFVHFSAVLGEGFKKLAQGDRVEFDVVEGGRGRQAANVVKQ